MNYMSGPGKYLADIEIQLKYTIKYRVELVANLLRTLISPLAIIIVWGVAYAASGTSSINGFSGSMLFSYFLIASAVGAISVSAPIAFEIQNNVQSGYISVHLIKPVSYLWYLLVNNFGQFIVNLAVTLIPVLVLIILLLHPQITALAFLEFLLELTLISLMTAMMFLTVGTLSVYFVSINGMINLLLWGFNVLGGRLIPLNVMPAAISSALQKTPIYLIYYLPSATFTGIATQAYIMQGLMNLLMWIAVFALVAALSWRISKKRLFASGG